MSSPCHATVCSAPLPHLCDMSYARVLLDQASGSNPIPWWAWLNPSAVSEYGTIGSSQMVTVCARPGMISWCVMV